MDLMLDIPGNPLGPERKVGAFENVSKAKPSQART